MITYLHHTSFHWRLHLLGIKFYDQVEGEIHYISHYISWEGEHGGEDVVSLYSCKYVVKLLGFR